MFEMFSYDFMIRAFLIGFACAIVSAVLGNFLVASRQSVMSDMLAHTSLAGVGFGIVLHVSPSLMAMGVAILASIALFLLSQNKKLPAEAVSVLLLSSGIAIALWCVHWAKNASISLESFLFGSLLTITTEEVSYFLALSLVLLIIIFVWYNRFLCLVLDKEFFESRFGNSAGTQIVFFVMMGLLVAFSLKIIGGLLMSSLLVIPVLFAQQFATTFRQSLVFSIFANIVGITLGLTTSFYFDIPTSSAVVMSLVLIFLIGFGVKKRE